jgi:glycosyltransferase involved in cell wall biosynthesis
MKISVIIATHNRSDMLAVALESLAQMTVPPNYEWEVLIVDNNSEDSTRAVAESLVAKYAERFRYIFESRQGKSFALNSGIASARGDILAFTDDDITVDPNWIVELCATMESFDCAGVGGKIVPVWNIPKPGWLEMDGPYRLMNAVVSFDLGSNPCPITTAALGANFAFKKGVFTKYGAFRTDLGPTVGSEIRGEDSELCRRLIKAGETLIYSPSAIVYHPVEHRRTEKRYFQAWYLGRGRASIREAGVPKDAVRYFGVPRYMFLPFLGNLLRWVLGASPKLRFYYKLQLYEIWGQMLEAKSNFQGSH